MNDMAQKTTPPAHDNSETADEAEIKGTDDQIAERNPMPRSVSLAEKQPRRGLSSSSSFGSSVRRMRTIPHLASSRMTLLQAQQARWGAGRG